MTERVHVSGKHTSTMKAYNLYAYLTVVNCNFLYDVACFNVHGFFFVGYRLALGKANKRQLKKNRRAIIDEFNLYYETEHICTAITMLDKASLQSGVVKFWTEVVENRFLKRILRMRMKEGLYEVPGSRSPHIRMKDYNVIRIDLDGNMGKIRDLSSDHYFISYLSSSNQNYRSFPVEPRRDPRGRNIGVINYYRESGQEDVCVHLVAVDTERFLISGPRLPTSHSEAKPREFIPYISYS